MALSNYTDLKASVAKWLNRRDLTDQIPDFITLAEAEIRRELRRTTVRATVQISSEEFALPGTVAELRSIRLVTGSPRSDLPLTNTSPEILSEIRARRSTPGRPTAFAHVGGKLIFVPTPDDTYNAEIVYFEKLPSLTDSAPTNSVFLESPDLYLFGALKNAEPYLKNDDRIATWETKFAKALEQLRKVREREEFTASLLPIRLPVRIG